MKNGSPFFVPKSETLSLIFNRRLFDFRSAINDLRTRVFSSRAMEKIMLKYIIICFLLPSIFLVAQSPVPSGATVDKIASGYQFTEGPVWHPDNYLIFSDIPANTIYKWDPQTEQGSIFLNPSGNSNGLSRDLDNTILLCQHGERRVARLNADGSETALATHFDGKRLNSPNDLTVGSDGSIYFTDPPYGISSGQEELGFYGIYRIAPNGDVIVLDKSLDRPNGICLSPDEKKLYVNDSQARKIYVWDINDDLSVDNKSLFLSMSGSGNADGMKADIYGNIYSTGPGGVWIIKPDGEMLDKISVPEKSTNVNWGGVEAKTLYITAGNSVYSIDLLFPGTVVSDKVDVPSKLVLYPNYPNPFNPSTTIRFSLTTNEHVQIDVVDVHGRIVQNLANEAMSSGEHAVVWNSETVDAASGIYFIRMRAGDVRHVEKMTLVK
jgi:gluconolactonase